MDETLNGGVALITGGSRGIGAAVALRPARLGADVTLTCQENADRAGGRRATAVRADSAGPAAVTAPADIAATVAFLAGPDSRYITGTTLHVDGGVSS
ncbi:SDR family oxidoreductase [Catenuloplanes indicus]|uniref:NAD(P)-dependent dehydrogenase (Short-subunit alcohol dehydrogenase family) n=1 Tax=Catenuloplanes indicus TaxID=137267 RepID=A0AAE3VVC4_9ACTN|nr:SDR family oxidoreductase [Catenuloplanes indicus]MDQ0363685.1 NAD(P)-dependent dehydrogenase (short-subunit alcohol dehydrogenase family) [Catenuloplanes indicus]